MFCPECKAEYRPGFARCADCDVDLVWDLQSTSEFRKVRRQETPENFSEQLWHGEDPQFYLWLIRSLSWRGVPSLARPVHEARYESFADQPEGRYEQVEFEILVSRGDLPFAKWILSDAEEARRVEDAAEAQAEEETSDSGVDGSGAVCPLCFGEFRDASRPCPNCGAPLRARGDLKKDGATQLCNLWHPQFLADLRDALGRERIPFDNAKVRRGGVRSGKVMVLGPDYDRATKVLAQVLQYWEFERSLNLGTSRDPRESYWSARAKNKHWEPEDLESVAWAGERIGVLESIGMAFREHEIAYRVDCPEPGRAKIFIHAGDQEAAREIVRDVLEGPGEENDV